MIDTQPDIGEPRRTYAEALADADLDMLLYGSIYVIRNADGMYQRVSPRCITVRADA